MPPHQKKEFRFIVAIDVLAQSLDEAYRTLREQMEASPFQGDWETTEEAYEDGEILAPEAFEIARRRAYKRHLRPVKNPDSSPREVKRRLLR